MLTVFSPQRERTMLTIDSKILRLRIETLEEEVDQANKSLDLADQERRDLNQCYAAQSRQFDTEREIHAHCRCATGRARIRQGRTSACRRGARDGAEAPRGGRVGAQGRQWAGALAARQGGIPGSQVRGGTTRAGGPPAGERAAQSRG
jgi:hypothetical protein